MCLLFGVRWYIPKIEKLTKYYSLEVELTNYIQYFFPLKKIAAHLIVRYSVHGTRQQPPIFFDSYGEHQAGFTPSVESQHSQKSDVRGFAGCPAPPRIEHEKKTFLNWKKDNPATSLPIIQADVSADYWYWKNTKNRKSNESLNHESWCYIGGSASRNSYKNIWIVKSEWSPQVVWNMQTLEPNYPRRILLAGPN